MTSIPCDPPYGEMAWGAPVFLAWALTVQVPTSTTVRVDEIPVNAPFDESADHHDPTSAEKLISDQDLARARLRGTSVTGLVDTVAGARVLDLGGPLGDRLVTIRGGSPGQSTIVVDDVVLRSPFARGPALGLVDPELVEDMRVRLGGQGAMLGDGALTGALVLRTRRPEEAPKTRLGFSLGSFRTARFSASHTSAPVSIGAFYRTTGGRFTFVSQDPGLANAPPRARTNNDGKEGGITFSGRHRLGVATLRATGQAGFSRSGAPGLVANLHPEARSSRTNGALRLQADIKPGGVSGPKFRVGSSATLLQLAYRDPALALSSESRLTNLTVDGGAELPAGDHLLRVGGQFGVESVNATEYDETGRLRGALHASDEWLLDPVTVVAAVRLTVVSRQGATVLPRVGARWDFGGDWALRAGLSRSLRTPTLDELYRPTESGISGNPNLAPETAWELDASMGQETRERQLVLRAFGRRISNAILYINRNAFLIRPENLGAADALGAELEVGDAIRVGRFVFGAAGTLSLLHARLRETGDPLPTQPAWTGFARLRARAFGFELATEWRGFASTSVNLVDAPINRVPTYHRWDASLSWDGWDALGLALVVNNLLDDRSLESVNKIPLPGLSVFVSARTRFGG